MGNLVDLSIIEMDVIIVKITIGNLVDLSIIEM